MSANSDRRRVMHAPVILTQDVQTRLATMNAASRQLRKLGLRVVEQQVVPEDNGCPVVDVGQLPSYMAERLIGVAGGSTHNAAACQHSAQVFGVRIIWTTSQ